MTTTLTLIWLTLYLQPSPDVLFTATRFVETGGSENNLNALGDGGVSLGMYQISEAYWQDGCEHGGVDWDYSLCLIPRYAEQVMRWYWDRYGATTNEQRARMHCAGPDGPAQSCSLEYWEKVQRAMN